jgi:hypothetical protein
MCAVLCSKFKRDHRRVNVDWTSLIMRVEKWMRSLRFTGHQFCPPPLSDRSVPMRNYTANYFHRSFCLCRFHATPCARSSHARADMHAAAREVDAKLEETSTFPCQCVITNYTAENYHRSICFCRFHSTPCARSSRAWRTCTPPLEKWMRS